MSKPRDEVRQTGTDAALREHLSRALDWQDAHVSIASAVADFPIEQRGHRPPGWPHSAWELLEHVRFTQRDILTFCMNPHYAEPDWPDDYWPRDAAPPSADAWDDSLQQFLADLGALKNLALDPSIDLFATIPHGSGPTYLRELLLIVDHNAYHLGQLVALRRVLDIWPR